MPKLMIAGLVTALGFCSPALAQRPGGAKEPAPPAAAAPPPGEVHLPLCVYHNITYSKGAVICIGTGWAQTCLADGGWGPINPDPRTFGNACGDAKSVPPTDH